MPSINIIVAYSKNNIIGLQGQMPWHIPTDLAYFKKTTMGAPIIMGRITWESLGRPLPGRLNIVISRDASYIAEGAELVADLDAAIALAKEKAPAQDIFILGGGQIYAEALAADVVNKVYATEIHNKIEGDTVFPALDKNTWKEVSRSPQPIDNNYDFDFVVYERV